MNTLSDEEFEQIYGRKPVRRVKKKKIYWNRIIIALIILVMDQIVDHLMHFIYGL